MYKPLCTYIMSRKYSIFLTKCLLDKHNAKTCNLLAARQLFKIPEFNVLNSMFFLKNISDKTQNVSHIMILM